MKKLKRLSKNKKFVFIYGAPAVGKFSVAQELEKITSFKTLHNHDIIDLVQRFFERGTKERSYLRVKLNLSILDLLLSQGANVITTHAYAHNFIFSIGISDQQFVKYIKKIVEKYGFKFCPVQLVCNEKEILKRVNTKDRKKFLKLKDIKIMKQILKDEDFVTPFDDKNNLIIDNTKVSPKKVAEIIKKHFKLN